MKLEGNIALVTGGGSGLGAVTAETLAAAGVKVTVLDINKEAAEAVAAKIGGLAIVCDVASPEAAEAAIAQAREAHGAARILINCAGIGLAKRILGKEGPQALSDFERVIRINLLGSFNMLRLAAADMSKLEPLEDGERGVIVNTASAAAFDG